MPTISHLRVVLRGISPLIWRRLLVRGDSTIADLHHPFQIAIGRSDTPLHRFVIHGIRLCSTVVIWDWPGPLRREQALFGKQVGEEGINLHTTKQPIMGIEQQLLDQRGGLLATRFPDGLDGQASLFQ